MDPALKQRLVGAAVLVALAVIFVPMLLEAPEPEATPAGQLSLDLPSRPPLSMETRDVPLSLPQPGTQTAAVDPDAVATVDVDAAPRVDALDAADQAPPASAASTSVPSPVPALPPPAPPQTTPAPATPAPNPAAPPMRPAAAAAPAPAPAPIKPAPAASASANGRYVVNLGSYSNLGNADALAKRLVQRGFPVTSETITLDGKPARRLRAGPYRTRADAESAALGLGKAEPGTRFTVGELDEAAALPASAPRAGPVASGFAVQLGAFKDEAEATALRDRLRKAGFTAYTERASTDAGTLWRVRAGPELQRARAEALQARIRQSLKLDGIVVSHP